MLDYKLANIFVENNDRFLNSPELYVMTNGLVRTNGSAYEFTLSQTNAFDFSTYFNSFSLGKWKEYASIDNVWLHMEAKGKITVELFEIDELSIGVHKWIVDTIELDSDEYQSVDLDYPQSSKAILSFRIITSEEASIRNAYYFTKIDESRIRDVSIAIATTTFRKEDYIANNVKMFKEDIKGSDDAIADNCAFVIVDNGRTLDAQALSGDEVYVFPNKNVGGAGGFARGMIEAKRLGRKITHVLIMDDDVSLSPEAIKKTYTLLSIVNNKYEKAFISGAMFSLGMQSVQIEDLGYASKGAKFGAIKVKGDMAELANIVKNEKHFMQVGNKYAAFWYCCIPMSTIEENGLPLPIFIRYDDAEYGMRCKPRFITMNGINIWHMDFNDRYSAVYEQYFGARNALIIQSTSGVCKNIDFIKTKFVTPLQRELKKFHYGSAELIVDALEDYLKGPEWLMVENNQEILADKNKKVDSEKMRSFKELGIKSIEIEKVREKNKSLGSKKRIIFNRTMNGHVKLPKRMVKGGTGWAKFSAGGLPGNKIYLKNRLIEVDRTERNAIVSERDNARFAAIMQRFNKALSDYEQRGKEVGEQYARMAPVLTSESFWLKYLAISNETA